MANYVVTGANRGIGLEVCRQLSARGDTVAAVCRTSNDALAELDVKVIDDVDVADGAAVERLAAALHKTAIDVLINNAGILIPDSLQSVDYEQMVLQFRINTLGPLRVTRALLPNLDRGSKVAIVSSRVGSIADNGSGANYGYRVSKTGVNMVAMNLRRDLEEREIAVGVLHPGLVATNMTGGRGIDPVDSARGVIARIDDLNMSNTGGFWHAEGYELPW